MDWMFAEPDEVALSEWSETIGETKSSWTSVLVFSQVHACRPSTSGASGAHKYAMWIELSALVYDGVKCSWSVQLD